MTNKSFQVLLIASALLFSSAKAGLSQQMSTPSGGAASKGHAGSGGTTSGAGLTFVPDDIAKMRIAPGFLLNLNVLDDGDFAGSYRVDQQGNIVIPVIGNIHVGGDTEFEARDRIQKRLLQDKILINPQVSLMVTEYTAPQVTIIGEVSAPGRYPLLSERRLIDVLLLAGGTTVSAGNEVEITRGDAEASSLVVHYSKSSSVKSVEDVMVHPGDTIQVKRAGIVYILGAVNRPGGYVMQEEGTLTVLQALSLAFGTSGVASGNIYVLRTNDDKSMALLEIPYRKISLGKTPDIQLHATDVLYVPSNKLKVMLSTAQPIMNAAAVSAIYKF